MDNIKAQLKFSSTISSSDFILISPSTFDHPSASKRAIFGSSSSQSCLRMAVSADPPDRAGQAQPQTLLLGLLLICKSALTHQPELFRFGLMHFLQMSHWPSHSKCILF